MNKVILSGHLTKDVEVRARQDGKTYGKFTLAVNKGFGKQQNGNEPTADFFTCFMNNAEKIAPYLLKGTKIMVEGSVHVKSDKDQNGNWNTQVSVTVQTLEFCGTKASNGQPSATGAPVNVAPQTPAPAPMAPNYPPQAQYPPQPPVQQAPAPQAPPAPAYVPQAQPAPAPVSAPPVAPAPQAPAPAQYQAPPAGIADEDIPF